MPIPVSSLRLFCSCVPLLLLLGCSDAEKTEPAEAKKPAGMAAESTDVEPDDHKFMVELLANVAKSAIPEENYHLNSAMAESLRGTWEGVSDDRVNEQIHFDFGKQLLYAGRVDEAIATFEQIDQQLGGIEKALNPQTKEFYEILAVAHLRKGEQENCVANHNNDSCIIPLSEIALHQHKTGSEKAIGIYEHITKRFPTDMQSQYLMGIAQMTLGQPSILNQLSQSHDHSIPPWKNIASSLGVSTFGIAGGCAVDDFNNDGHLDIVASSYGYEDQLRYYENDGLGGFVDKTISANLKGITGGLNINHADFDNDGNLDVWVMRGGWLGKGGLQPNSLLKGNGDGTFSDVTRSSGLLSRHPTQTSVWADFNLDGHLDLFIGNETTKFNYGGGTEFREAIQSPCELYINQGNGKFQEAAAKAGVDLDGFVKGVTAGDFDNDGYPDLYVSVIAKPNILLRNTSGETNTISFREDTTTARVAAPKFSFPAWVWDYDNDGHEDIYVAAYNLPNMSRVGEEYLREKQPQASLKMIEPALYRNKGDGTFTDVTSKVGLSKSMFSMGCNFGDLDNDGFLDFYVGTGAPDLRSIAPNRMFRNRDGKSFEEVTFEGFAHIQKGHGVGWGDLDCDGDQDIYIVMGGAFEGDVAQNALFENPGSNYKWIVLDLEGRQSNRAAIGARVEIVVTQGEKSRSIFRTVGSGASFGSNSLQLEIGLGDAEAIETVKIRWPRKDIQPVETGSLPLNSKVVIVEGQEDQWKKIPYEKVPFAIGH